VQPAVVAQIQSVALLHLRSRQRLHQLVRLLQQCGHFQIEVIEV
jgi:hypothetical protein